MSFIGASAASAAAGSAATTAAVLAARRARAEWVRGKAAERLAALGDRALVLDLYDAGGAERYHALARGDHSEVREVLAVVRRRPGPVLELAAGSGRLTLPLVAAGARVTAVDLSEPMLAILRSQLAALPGDQAGRCRVVRADMTSFRLRGRFRTVVLGASSVSLLDERGRLGMMRCVRREVAKDGTFVLSTAVGHEGADATGPEVVTPLPDGGAVHEYWAPGADARVVTIFPPDDGQGPVEVYTSTVRVLRTELLTDELEQAGFAVERVLPVRSDSRSRHALELIEAVPR